VITIWEIEADSKQEALVFADEGVARPSKLHGEPNYKTIEAELGSLWWHSHQQIEAPLLPCPHAGRKHVQERVVLICTECGDEIDRE
jgi:hypothetical protein